MFSKKCFCKENNSKIVRPLLAALSVNGLNKFLCLNCSSLFHSSQCSSVLLPPLHESWRSGDQPGDRRHGRHLRLRLEPPQRHPGVQPRPSYRPGQSCHDLPLCNARLGRGADHAGCEEEDDADPFGGATRARQ